MRRILFVFASAAAIPAFVFGQACTNPGTGNVCAPTFSNTASVAKTGGGVSTDGSWALINHQSDPSGGDEGCYYSGNINFAYHNATITMQSGSYQCGQSDTTAGTQSYLSGAMTWKNLAYAPSQMTSGTVTIEAKIKAGQGWPAFWLLGGNGNTSSSTGCQYSTINHSWDNVDNCNWSSDSSDSAENDVMEMVNAYTYTRENVFSNGSSVTYDSGTISDASQNFHLYHVDWSASKVCWAVDGVQQHCETSLVPQNPMFVIINLRVSGAGPPASFPQVMTMQYVQACDGATCTSQDGTGGNTVFLDDFGSLGGNAVSFSGRFSEGGKAVSQ